MVCHADLCLRRLLADRRGISAIEYAVLALGIIPLVALAAAALGGGVQPLYTAVTAVLH